MVKIPENRLGCTQEGTSGCGLDELRRQTGRSNAQLDSDVDIEWLGGTPIFQREIIDSNNQALRGLRYSSWCTNANCPWKR